MMRSLLFALLLTAPSFAVDWQFDPNAVENATYCFCYSQAIDSTANHYDQDYGTVVAEKRVATPGAVADTKVGNVSFWHGATQQRLVAAARLETGAAADNQAATAISAGESYREEVWLATDAGVGLGLLRFHVHEAVNVDGTVETMAIEATFGRRLFPKSKIRAVYYGVLDRWVFHELILRNINANGEFEVVDLGWMNLYVDGAENLQDFEFDVSENLAVGDEIVRTVQISGLPIEDMRAEAKPLPEGPTAEAGILDFSVESILLVD